MDKIIVDCIQGQHLFLTSWAIFFPNLWLLFALEDLECPESKLFPFPSSTVNTDVLVHFTGP